MFRSLCHDMQRTTRGFVKNMIRMIDVIYAKEFNQIRPLNWRLYISQDLIEIQGKICLQL